jgi:hypothetical protein
VWVNAWGISPLFVTRYSANSKFNSLPGSFFSFILVVGTSAPTISNLVLIKTVVAAIFLAQPPPYFN